MKIFSNQFIKLRYDEAITLVGVQNIVLMSISDFVVVFVETRNANYHRHSFIKVADFIKMPNNLQESKQMLLIFLTIAHFLRCSNCRLSPYKNFK